MFLLVKYPFISEINATIQNPLKSPFEALNYYMGLKPSHAKTDFSIRKNSEGGGNHPPLFLYVRELSLLFIFDGTI